jgi:YegS/Rv2252/BmrU family lipid kinase
VKPHLIVNPASASGRTGRHFDAIARAVQGAVGDFECAFTHRRGHATVLAREVVRGGARLVVAVGGDGTASEVIDGLAQETAPAPPGPGPRTPDVTFGFIPRGTGGDFRRTLGWPSDPAQAAVLLSSGAERAVDLGRIELIGHDGRPLVRHFANVAGFGISGRVVQEVERLGKALGGRLAFMLASARVLAGWSDQRVRWRADGGPWNEDRVTALSVCNGRFFGGGMMVAPEARVDDGLFDVTVWRGIGLSDFVLKKGMLYDGTHVRLPNTRTLRASVIEAEPLGGEPVLLDVDGEQPGRLPARFTVLPGALHARVPVAA